MLDYRVGILGFLLVAGLLVGCSDSNEETRPAVYAYTLSDKAVCLYPHSSWLPDFYTQYDHNDLSEDHGCADNYGSFECEWSGTNQCTYYYDAYGKQGQEIFDCYPEGDQYYCYGGGQYQHEYIVCDPSRDSDGHLYCYKGEQFYSNSQPAPEPPWFNYSDLAVTIRHFTQQSIDRAGLTDQITISSVSASPGADATVTLSGYNEQLLMDFASLHQRVFDDSHAAQGLAGIKNCQNTDGCWEPYIGNSPWAFYLPLGLAMIGQKIVNYLNYPPYDALTSADYLDNFTMDRWNRVLSSAGISDPYLYDTIVDSRPIAAPGSGQSAFLPDIQAYFNNENTGAYYVVPMINLLNDPPTNNSAGYTLPVMVLGSDARDAWAEITGQPKEETLPYVGSVVLPGSTKVTPWVATNHPDVTTYQCCPGDPSPSCSSGGYQSFDLVADEQIDMQAICTAQMLSDHSTMLADDALAECKKKWVTNPSEQNLRTLCINAKLDYNYPSTGRCESMADAESFCAIYNNDPCPQGIYTCDVN